MVRDGVRPLRRLGLSYTSITCARKTLGVTKRRIGGPGKKGDMVYELPEKGKEKDVLGRRIHVFLCGKFRPWNRVALTQKFARIREMVGLPDDCLMYGIRHFFGTWAVKRNVNLKAVATLLGHTSTAMV